ncbi:MULTISPECIES: MbcA/ParS/Xre antitoxin family protein [Sphingomonadaceae]|uniref:Uncharacterized protein n=4 Tax=Sphingomonadaceae TaxID=41297 RepID=A0A1E1EXX2_9SPHN|nr:MULTISPECIES: MbcA/ParS/Xre antitoxin family protein [Sphingomonadaceae]MCT2400746.1 MbcA/ParS/Xre antitoxin family protein [Novosphingobium mangrovi (ex Huang et al. 2023)]BAV63116.1 hypothetical protein SCLO_1000760 [Sphingobium cloacae]GGN54757.1 hypothetical protein GCM10011349_30730 [Novosphingobium indicum]
MLGEVYAIDAQQEAAAFFRTSLNLFEKWGVTEEQAAMLLDLPLRTYRQWKEKSLAKCSSECHARLSNLMGIQEALMTIFRKPERAYSWIRMDNAAFDGVSALHLMLNGELADIIRVRRYLEAECAGG